MERRGRPPKADRKILAQQLGTDDNQAVEFSALLHEQSGAAQGPLDTRLSVRYGTWRRFGCSRDDALVRAGGWPDLYSYYERKGEREDIALKRLSTWRPGESLPADLDERERPAHVSPQRVKLALTRTREESNEKICTMFRHLTETRRMPLNQAILETCRICGMGPGRADVDGRGEGLSETIAVLRAAGFSEVTDSKLRSPRALRR